MSKLIDLTGQRFGRLSVIKRAENHKGRVAWLCKCDCGKFHIIISKSLRNGACQSCGCLDLESRALRQTTHNLSNTKLYNIYMSIKSRCKNINNERFSSYGGRGITICEEWNNDFLSFYNWSMSNGYIDGLTIDRINNNGSYEPNNCRWTDMKVQNNNRRNNKFITYNGKTKTLQQWADSLGINQDNLSSRLIRGWTFEKAISYKPNETHYVYIEYNNKKKTISEWAREQNIPMQILWHRIRIAKWDIEKALITPVRRIRNEIKRLSD